MSLMPPSLMSLPLCVRHGQDDAAVHEAAFFGPVVDFRRALAVAGGGDLVGVGAVLHQKCFHGFGAREREFVVVSGGPDVVRVARYFDTVVSDAGSAGLPGAAGWDIRPIRSRN